MKWMPFICENTNPIFKNNGWKNFPAAFGSYTLIAEIGEKKG
ncbi:hypothetical protein ACLJJ6_02175 [Pediococcus siamensis]